ncbi:MAG: hypothetical protein SPI19_03210 [Peptoniphilaceae bacterium]|nr:hypothetical protein [Peptoniphilaceae bacterium]
MVAILINARATTFWPDSVGAKIEYEKSDKRVLKNVVAQADIEKNHQVDATPLRAGSEKCSGLSRY